MDDLISRQAVFDMANTWTYNFCDPEDEWAAMKEIKDLPSAQQWIPCSERLPEDWVPVLVTLKRPERLPAWIKAKPENYFHIVDADVCENGEWTVNKKNVIAWMPLPEPYKGEQE